MNEEKSEAKPEKTETIEFQTRHRHRNFNYAAGDRIDVPARTADKICKLQGRRRLSGGKTEPVPVAKRVKA